jgi:hypothetical protein
MRGRLLSAAIALFVGLDTHLAYAQDHSSWCYPRSAPRINITPTTEDIFFNFTKTENELNNFKIDTVNPYGKDVIVDVGGLMLGGIELTHSASIGYISNPNYNLSCLWFDTLNIDIGIKPTIYIAKEYNKGTCMHNAIMEHEMKHIKVDRDIVNKYANIIGYKINDKLTRETIYGPAPTSGDAAQQAQMMQSINDIIKGFIDELQIERKIAQQGVDTVTEYDGVSAKCAKITKYKRKHKRH